jgi:uncharacterized membrane protein
MAAPRHRPPSPLVTGRAALLFALLGAASPLSIGCSKAKDPSQADAKAQAIADVDARTRGAWVLQSFVPDTPLEPMLQTMLDFQFGRLVVRLDGKRMVADSTGIHVDRAYKISEVNGDQFKMTSFDTQGVAYESTCMFLPDGKVEIHATTSPWRGVAVVSRAGP